jgi:hypothetical protein
VLIVLHCEQGLARRLGAIHVETEGPIPYRVPAGHIAIVSPDGMPAVVLCWPLDEELRYLKIG